MDQSDEDVRRNNIEYLTKHLLHKTFSSKPPDYLDDTPMRFAKAWEHWTSGYNEDPAEILKTFDCPENDSMVFQTNIPMWSLCEHHLSPFWGRVHIGYIPNGRVVGLSKLARLVDVYARRLQLQERLCSQIADAMMQHVGCRGAGVVIQARHSCMESRGVQKAGTITITSALRGCVKDDSTCRSEFMSLVNVAVQGAQGV